MSENGRSARRVVLHVGMHKTGTTYLQNLLRQNRRRLARRAGVYVPPGARKTVFASLDLIPWDSAQVHVMSHVVNYGSSVFEGVRCYSLPSGPAIFRAPEHMQRLLDSAKVYRIDVAIS